MSKKGLQALTSKTKSAKACTIQWFFLSQLTCQGQINCQDQSPARKEGVRAKSKPKPLGFGHLDQRVAMFAGSMSVSELVEVCL